MTTPTRPVPAPRTLGLITSSLTCKPAPLLDIVLTIIQEHPDIQLAGLKIARPTPDQAEDFYAPVRNSPQYADLIKEITGNSGIYILDIKATRPDVDAIEAWLNLIGDTKKDKEKSPPPHSLRVRLAKITPTNPFHGSDSYASYEREKTITSGWLSASHPQDPSLSDPDCVQATDQIDRVITLTSADLAKCLTMIMETDILYDQTVIRNTPECQKAFSEIKALGLIPNTATFEQALDANNTDINVMTRMHILSKNNPDFIVPDVAAYGVMTQQIPATPLFDLWVYQNGRTICAPQTPPRTQPQKPTREIPESADTPIRIVTQALLKAAPHTQIHGWGKDCFWGDRIVDNRIIGYFDIRAEELPNIPWSEITAPLTDIGCSDVHVSMTLFDAKTVWASLNVPSDPNLGKALEAGKITPAELPVRTHTVTLGFNIPSSH